jgi:sterol desaturase/sphingolipid hydroxylase (fatty acid hydroxylase superfamily)
MIQNEFIQKLLYLLIWNAGELIVFGLMMILLQVFLSAHKEQKMWDRSSVIDISYSFILAFCTPFFYLVPISIVDSLVQQNPTLASFPSQLSEGIPLLLQVLIAVFIIDFIGYWRHRMMHTKWLWPIHAIHHCSKRLDWLSNERFHFLNYFITLTINVVPTQLLFGPEVALLGALLRRLYNFVIHTNVRMDYGIASYIFVSPRFHHWHHSADEIVADKNYCTFFSCIDWMFGTYYLPGDKRYPDTIGERDHIKENLIVQLLHPFKVWKSFLWK